MITLATFFRQERVIYHARRPFRNFANVDRATGAFAGFYNWPTRKNHLEAYLKSLDPPQKLFNLLFIKPMRWIEHGYRVTNQNGLKLLFD